MGTIEQAIVSRTLTTGYPVFPMVIPQSQTTTPVALPCYTYQMIDAVPLHFLVGINARLDTGRVQFTAYSERISDVEAMVEAIRNLWHGYSGTIDGCQIVVVYQSDEPDFEEYRSDGSDTVAFMGTFDLFFRWRT